MGMEGDGGQVSTCSRPGSQEVCQPAPPAAIHILSAAWAPNLAVSPLGLFLSPPRSIPSANPIGSTCQIRPEPDYSSPTLPGPSHRHLPPTQSPDGCPCSAFASVLMAARGILLKVSQILSLLCLEPSRDSHLTQSRSQKPDRSLEGPTASASGYLSDRISCPLVQLQWVPGHS